MKKLFTALTLVTSLHVVANEAPKNIIMVISDGMGPAYTTAYRYFNDDPTTPEIETTVFDKYHIGSSSTYPAPVSGLVTDSAASATALASGVKSYNGAIGVDVDEQPVESVLYRAKAKGLKTGIVVTSQINHATPAAYMAHNKHRRNYDEIADSYYDDRNNNQFLADIMLGGGWSYFIRQDRNLVSEFKSAGFHYLDNFSALNSLPKSKPVLGLFDDKGLAQALDHQDKYRLATMTEAALDYLTNEKGMFLLVEASQVDWGGHNNDIAYSMAEMSDLDKTIQVLEAYVAKHPDTLVVLTADHSTGGMTIGANGKYAWFPTWIKNLTASTETIANDIAEQGLEVTRLANQLGFQPNEEEMATLAASMADAENYWLTNQVKFEEKGYTKQSTISRSMRKAVLKLIDQRTNTGWTTSGHTGVDVPVYAFGKNAELFKGQLDNTDIAKGIFSLIEKR
ncbi:alkaline phosphatase [Thalassotalea sp. LPB0316]|uniref:alkaline phosphatase n=1 Tax=Thalassotalea sp. LPB0316 TaxID=2769490 RepID=UPI001866731F|nr:alkaline phosphatase [Thalassotalea sp. LPB0316]QOL24827.1 alkaline phosphatase [Thalassotalea sp. LPB0316]